jgi:SNF2 family DNA or RNA helicase
LNSDGGLPHVPYQDEPIGSYQSDARSKTARKSRRSRSRHQSHCERQLSRIFSEWDELVLSPFRLGSYGTKIEAVITEILRILAREPEAKILLFSQWSDILMIMRQALKENEVNFLDMEGSKKKVDYSGLFVFVKLLRRVLDSRAA